jgi:hypothetical protein
MQNPALEIIVARLNAGNTGATVAGEFCGHQRSRSPDVIGE